MRLFFLLVALSFSLGAEPPRKHPLTKYRQLWDQSLVTVKPLPDEPDSTPAPTPLDDFVLGGWTKTDSGYVVSLINTKDRKNRVTIAPGMPVPTGFEGVQVRDVRRNPSNYTKTEVLVAVGGQERWIGYDDKFLTLQRPATPAAAKPNNAQRNAPANNRVAAQNRRQNPPVPTNASSNTNTTQSGARQPRVRRVPTPPKN